jgi:hypothetical protein
VFGRLAVLFCLKKKSSTPPKAVPERAVLPKDYKKED